MYPRDECNAVSLQKSAGMIADCNPTLAQNIDGKIQYHRDEIERLLKVKAAFPPDFLGMNLRDLQEAMRF